MNAPLSTFNATCLLLSILTSLFAQNASLNWVTSADSWGPAPFRSALARSTSTSSASVPRTRIVSSINSASGIALSSLLLPSRSVCTHGGANSRTLTGVPLSLYRRDIVYECIAALVDEYTAVTANGTNPRTDVVLITVASVCRFRCSIKAPGHPDRPHEVRGERRDQEFVVNCGRRVIDVHD